jgi:hypothetical protein
MFAGLQMSNWVALIEAEYREMPGLQLTGRQMQRLWGLDRETCDAIVEVLVSRRILCETSKHAYMLAERRQASRVKLLPSPYGLTKSMTSGK